MRVRTKTYFSTNKQEKIFLSFWFFTLIILSFLHAQMDIELIVKYISIAAIISSFCIFIYTLGNDFRGLIWRKIKYDFIKAPHFQKVESTNMLEICLKDSNLLNHHNYFKNTNLENRYSKYIFMSSIKYIISILFVTFGLVGPGLFYPEYLINIIVFTGAISIVLSFLFMNKIQGNKSNEIIKIYFRKITPTAFQKIKNTIFFY